MSLCHVLARRCLYASSHRSAALGLRRLSYVPQASSHIEKVTIPCNSNGEIDIDIHHPPSPPVTPRFLIHLPSSRHLLAAGVPPFADSHVPASLSRSSGATVAVVNYRLSRNDPYPTPIHDVLAGYEWVTANLARPHGTNILGVHGSLVGGSLALMLSMTEARLESDSRVAAVAVCDPVCNWVFEEDEDSGDSPEDSFTPTDTETPSLTKSALLSMRSRAFPETHPGRFFDAFASPLFFLRSPGTVVPEPPRPDPADEWATLIGLEDAEAGRSTISRASRRELSEIVSDGDTTIVDLSSVDAQRPKKPSRRTRRFPPIGSAPIIMPKMLITASKEGGQVLQSQASEMVRLLRKNMMGHRFDGVSQSEIERVLRRLAKRKDDTEEWEDLEKAMLMARREVEGVVAFDGNVPSALNGNWTASNDEHIAKVGRWFASALA